MNILVVEDEPLALDDLLGMLQVFAGAHTITGCASGAEALTHAEAAQPDLLITDIRMPEIDGLDQRLKARAPLLAAIVLSGYSEFEYARTGLRLGISDYLLKPVRTDVLHQTVARVLGSLAAERTHATRVREAELAGLLLGGQRASRAEPNLLGGDWGVIVLICENWEGPTIWRDTLIDRAFITHEVAADSHHCDIVDIEARCRLVLVPLAGPQLHVLGAIAQRLHRAIVAAGVTVHTTYVYKAAGERPERALSQGLSCLTHAMLFAMPTFAPPGAAQNDQAGEMMREHVGSLLARDLAEGRISNAIARLYAALGQLQRNGATQSAIIQITARLFGLLQQLATNSIGQALPDRDTIAAKVRACRTYEELTAWVDTQLRPLLMHQRGAATPRQLVRALVAQVHTAYAEDISLQEFAAEHNVSLAYFSRLFKDEIGMTFSDYLTRVRIEKAKELLHQNLRLSDISALVGYDDPKYFSQIFRKVVGVSALDYQRSHQRD
jgi:YesN/AraC family two-component response regulator